MSGPGGTGKSNAIDAVKHYCKLLCNKLKVDFTKRTIITTAMTGTAAVSIGGETTSSACSLNISEEKLSVNDDFQETIMIIIDEISFMSDLELNKLNDHLNILCDVKRTSLFGGLQVVFVGDFAQLPCPKGTPMYQNKHCNLKTWVNTYLELKTNHRFSNDPKWGELLARFRTTGPTIEDIIFINNHVIKRQSDLPSNTTYGVFTNVSRCAINEGIFCEFLKENHSQLIGQQTPDYSICIMASDMQLKKNQSGNAYADCSDSVKHIICSSCADCHITAGKKKDTRKGSKNKKRSEYVDPLLKLYCGRPCMITRNLSVTEKQANGTTGKFKRLKLKNDYCSVSTINIDGYYTKCVEAKDVAYIELELKDKTTIKVYPKLVTAVCEFPLLELGSTIGHNTSRNFIDMKLCQFPLNVCNATTVHKLQGKSLDTIVASEWHKDIRWIYVLLSRIKTSKGLYLRKKLPQSYCGPAMDPSCVKFMEYFEKHKLPKCGHL